MTMDNRLMLAGLALGLFALLFAQRARAATETASPLALPYPDAAPQADPYSQAQEYDAPWYEERQDYLDAPPGEPLVALDAPAVDIDGARQAQQQVEPMLERVSTNFDPVQNPNVRAFLDMIAFAEGADYSTLFGRGKFSGFDDHPRIVVRRWGKDGQGNDVLYASSAAGRYQIIRKTWDDVSRKIGATSFDPYWQDLAAIYLIRRKGALADVIAGRFSTAVNKVRRVWASLPGAGYNQPERRYDRLLQAYLDAGGTIATV